MSSFAPDTMRLGVAVGGFGAIGKVVAEHLDRGIEGLTLAAVSARDIVRAEATMAVSPGRCRLCRWRIYGNTPT